MEAFAPFGIILALAFLCESMTEYFFSDLMSSVGVKVRWLKYVAALVGVGLALAYGIDGIEEFLEITPQVPYLGEVLTGLLIGRGANFVHDFSSRFIGPIKHGDTSYLQVDM